MAGVKELTSHRPTDAADADESDPHGLQRVEPQDVVPEDLLLARVADGQREKAIHRVRILRVAVGVVRRRDEIVIAERVDDVLDELLVALDRAEALAAEVL